MAVAILTLITLAVFTAQCEAVVGACMWLYLCACGCVSESVQCVRL